MNYLVISDTASVGVVIFDGLLDKNLLVGYCLTGSLGTSSGFANVALACSAVAVVGIVVFTIRNFITKEIDAIDLDEE